MFIDESVITVSAGKGGDGCQAFRREKFVPMGGPAGGNGGRGGHVILEATDNVQTLHDIGSRRTFKARGGQPGGNELCTGKNGEDTVIRVPVGTLVKDAETEELLCDLQVTGEKFIIAKGGKGGLGNAHFKSATNRAPRKTTQGEPGESHRIRLELKLLADCGLVGLPNAGKSSLLRRCSSATPKVGDFPFTTTAPNLGVVSLGPGSHFVMVDIPGLIEGAAQGKGLGHQFLRHIERTSVLAFILDGARAEEKKQYKQLLKELGEFHPLLLEKPRILVVNKSDLREIDTRALAKSLKIPVLMTSAVTGQGIEEFKKVTFATVEKNRPIKKDAWLA